MSETQELFELSPLKYVPFVDVYHLKGEEKKNALDKMVYFTIHYQTLENPTQIDKRYYFDACRFLEADAIRQQTRMHISATMYNKMRSALVAAELDKFKTQVKLQFMEKYQKEMESKQFTPQMSKDLDKITKMERVACYMIQGIDVEMKNCETCKNKICQKKPKTEEEWEEEKEIANEKA